MDKSRSQRKLTAILSADVKGYSRLMRWDEQATVRTLKARRQAICQTIEEYRGRVVDSPGDNLLAEFASAVDAVEAAAEIQRRLALENADIPADKRMEFRIGINLGDVIAEDGRIYGDGVNVAARMENLAQPGGVAISQSVLEQIKRKTKLGFQSLGEHQVKNIDEPIKVYRVLLEPGDAGKLLEPQQPFVSRRTFLVALLFAAAALLAAMFVQQYFNRFAVSPPAQTDADQVKPSIAVLPFANLTGDPQDDIIGDGISIGVTMALSQNPKLFIVDRASAFSFREKKITARQVARKLGVRYVLEGDVQRHGDILRVSVRLADAGQGRLLWSDQFDRKTDNVFFLQDEITLKVASSLFVKLSGGEEAKLLISSTSSVKTWSKMIKAMVLFEKFSKEANDKSRELLREVVEIDPKYAIAWTLLAWTYWVDARLGFSPAPRDSFEKAVELARKATELDSSIPQVWALWGTIHLMQRDYDKALAAGAKSIELGPNMANNHLLYSQTLLYTGHLDQAIQHAKIAMRLYPTFPPWYQWHLGNCFFQAGRNQDAIEQYKIVLDRAQKGEISPLIALSRLAAAYAALGDEGQAKHYAQKALELRPDFRAGLVWQSTFYQDPARAERVVTALRKAGVPQ